MHGHHHFLHFLRSRELDELYISMALRSFALSMISIFIPIYLLKMGYQLTHVFTFYLIVTMTHIILAFPSAKISAKIGFKHSIFLSVPFLITFYFLMYTLDTLKWPLFLPATIFGIYSALFWVAYHMDFSKFSKSRERGKQVGVVFSLIFTFNALGPFVGGVIITTLGFHLLFIFASTLLLFSAVPLFFSQDFHEPFHFSFKKIFSLKRIKRNQKIRDGLSFFGFGAENVTFYVVWPIFIFFHILNNSYTTLGFIISLSIFFSTIFSFVIGFFSDINRRIILKIGSAATSVIWIIKSLVKTSYQVLFVDSLYGISRITMSVPFEAMSYDKAKRTEVLKYIVFREIMINFGRVFLLVLMISFSNFITGFLIASGLSLFLWFF